MGVVVCLGAHIPPPPPPDSLQTAGNAASGGFSLEIASAYHSSVRLKAIAPWAGAGNAELLSS